MSKGIVNIAVIGCGAIADHHIQGVLAKKEAYLYAVCDSATDDRLQKRKEQYGAEIAVADYRELLNDPKVDAVIVATPDPTHAEITAAFLHAGKDVLLEKPMALTLEDCEIMLKAEKESGCRLMVGQVCRYNHNFIQAKEIIDSGCLGELVFVESEYAHDYAIHKGYDLWRVNPQREGVIGGGCHAVDLLRWIAGDPTEVHAYANHKYLTEWPVNDTTIAVYKFPNNVIGKVFCSIGVKRNYTMRTSIYGTKGTLIFDSRTTQMELFECDKNGEGYEKVQIIPCDPKGHNMEAEVSAFVDSILNDTPVPISSMEGAYTVAVCRATADSANTGATVTIRYPQV